MSKNIFLIGLATITLAATALTALTNVASSRADTISIVGSGNSSSTGGLTVAPPPKNTPHDEGRYCAAVFPAPPGCSAPSNPSAPFPIDNRYTPPFSYPANISPFPYPNNPGPYPMSEQAVEVK